MTTEQAQITEFIDIYNPSTGEVIERIPAQTEADVDALVERAQQAFKTWGNTTPAERSIALLKLADIVEQNAERFAKLESENVGKPSGDAFADVELFVDNIRFYAGAARNLGGLNTGEYIADHTSMIRREPMGVVASITPWNYPLAMAGWKIGPALAAGNTVVLKPSELTPLTTLLLEELSRDILPEGVFNVVTGHGTVVGSALSKHPKVKMISLTGSVRAGKAVARDAVETLKKVHLELGGKAPVIAFDDANVDDLVEGMAMAAYCNSGQDCTAATRLYVQEGIYDEVVEKLTAAVKNIQVGTPNEEDTVMGPVISKEHLQRIAGFIERAKEEAGVEILAGGNIINRPGFFFEPTLVAGLTQKSEIVQEEIFGPVLAVLPFKTDEEVIEKANDCKYALASSIWTNDINRSIKTTKALEFGAVWTNTHITIVSEMPHGGSKLSGYGNDMSMYSLEEYTEIKHAMIKTK